MKLVGTEFVKSFDRRGEDLGMGYVLEFDGIAPLFFSHWFSTWFSNQDVLTLGGQPIRDTSIWDFKATNVDLVLGDVLGLPNGEWCFHINVNPRVKNNQGVLICDWKDNDLSQPDEPQSRAVARGRSSWSNYSYVSASGGLLLDDLCQNLSKCEDLLKFVVSPARHFERRELECQLRINEWERQIAKKRKTQDNWIAKKEKYGGLELK